MPKVCQPVLPILLLQLSKAPSPLPNIVELAQFHTSSA
jgi:hypothetical protein